jgi:hypothetical protein
MGVDPPLSSSIWLDSIFGDGKVFHVGVEEGEIEGKPIFCFGVGRPSFPYMIGIFVGVYFSYSGVYSLI